jgi:hypothetical protein
MFIDLLPWLQNLSMFSDLRASAYAYPIILALHLSFISLFAAMIVLTDVRLLGWGFQDASAADLIDRLRIPKRIGFVLAATCGFLLFCSKAEEYYYNPFFRLKVILFALVAAHALVFRRSVYRAMSQTDQPVRTSQQMLAGGLSLLLWSGILSAGRGIGYVAGRLGIHYS